MTEIDESKLPPSGDHWRRETIEIGNAIDLIHKLAAGPIKLPPQTEQKEQAGVKKEIEIKVVVEYPEVLRAFLESQGEFVSEDHQRDEYFSPTARDFLAVRPLKEWLRIRVAGDKHSVNYKNWYYDATGRATHCDEIEKRFVPQDAEQVQTTLANENFRTIVVVDKIRKTWRYQNYEIAFDAVEGLGEFVEVEYTGAGANLDPAAITSEMIAWLKELGCGKIERDYLGYPVLLLFPEERDREVL